MSKETENPVNLFEFHHSEVVAIEKAAINQVKEHLNDSTFKLLELGLFPQESVQVGSKIEPVSLLFVAASDSKQKEGIYLDVKGCFHTLEKNRSSYFDFDSNYKVATPNEAYFKYAKIAIKKMKEIYEDNLSNNPDSE